MGISVELSGVGVGCAVERFAIVEAPGALARLFSAAGSRTEVYALQRHRAAATRNWRFLGFLSLDRATLAGSLRTTSINRSGRDTETCPGRRGCWGRNLAPRLSQPRPWGKRHSRDPVVQPGARVMRRMMMNAAGFQFSAIALRVVVGVGIALGACLGEAENLQALE